MTTHNATDHLATTTFPTIQAGVTSDAQHRRRHRTIRICVLAPLGFLLAMVLLALATGTSTPTPAPAATFPAPATAQDGEQVRTPEGVATWIASDHQWVFCPTGWTDTQCGA
jgi:hypothetical protein